MYRAYVDSIQTPPPCFLSPYYGNLSTTTGILPTTTAEEDYTLSWLEYHYGGNRKNKYSWERDSEREKENKKGSNDPSGPSDPPAPKPDLKPKPKPKLKPKPKPEAPKEELAKVLNVLGIDLMIAENAKKHRTDMYECTDKDRERDGKAMDPECVVRRGDSMKITINFDRTYDKGKNDLSLKFSIGEFPSETKGTQIEIKLDESGTKRYKPEEWGANLCSIDKKSIIVEVFIPSNCVIGEWNLFVSTLSYGKDKEGKKTKVKFTFENDLDVIILFNAWCKDDLVYTEEDKEEYVLNECGFIYSGNEFWISPKPWIFGQFADQILECCLMLLRDAADNKYQTMWNPVNVCRKLAAIVNSMGMFGVIVGNWSGDYTGGTKPLTWIGSKNILKEYLSKRDFWNRSVKYGQCWVFSGVLTTVCRALGIPCRSVTNFSSAHDTDTSCTIDYFYKSEYEVDKNMTDDSIWNFHVWNEAYMRRPDLPAGFDGWQAIDSTPQEMSDGIYTCGPAPLMAIKKGRIDINFDVAFVFSEVNADRVEWKRGGPNDPQDWVVRAVKKDVIGKCISTKLPGPIEFSEDDLRDENASSRLSYIGRHYRMDVTDLYKYPEGSEEERKAVDLAYRLSMNPRRGVYSTTKVKPVTVDIHVEDGAMIGKDLDIEIEVTNPGHFMRNVNVAKLLLYPQMYTDETGDAFYEYDFGPRHTVNSNSSYKLSHKVTFDQYYKHLWEGNFIKIVAFLNIEPVVGEAGQEELVEHVFEFDKPELRVKAPKNCKLHNKGKFTVAFTNPLPIPLTECLVSVQSDGFEDINNIEVPKVPAKGKFEKTIEVKACKRKKHNLVFEFDSEDLFALTGMTNVEVVA